MELLQNRVGYQFFQFSGYFTLLVINKLCLINHGPLQANIAIKKKRNVENIASNT